MRRGACALVVAVACGALVAGCGEESDGLAAAGDVLAVDAGAVDGKKAVVQLPNGQLDLTVEPGATRVGADEAQDRTEHRAPDGGSLLGVSWRFRPGAGVPTWMAGVGGRGDQPVELAVGGAEQHDLGPAVRAAGDAERLPPAFFVALDSPEADAGDLVLEVSFEGVVQEIDLLDGEVDPGAAADLYDLPEKAPDVTDCGAGSWAEQGRARVQCGYWAASTPYVDGLGWREDGFTVVSVNTQVDGYTRDRVAYTALGQEDASTLAGRAPAQTHVLSEVGTKRSDLLVFDGTGTQLTIARTVGLRPESGGARVEVALRREVVLGP